MKKKVTIGIAGNPNSGKTTLFNALTGGRQRVGNWPGVTVERKAGTYKYKEKEIEVIDLPGIYSLSTSSLDEQIARDYILQDKPDLIVNIVDASNLERNLYLTIQLIEMRIPVVVVLNMMDVVKRRNLKIKFDDLARLLDIAAVPTVANKMRGIDDLRDIIDTSLEQKHISAAHIYFPEEVEVAIKKIITRLTDGDVKTAYDMRWTAIKILEDDISADDMKKYEVLHDIIAASKHEIGDILGEESDIIIAEGRYGFINSLCKKVVDKSNIIRKNVSDVIDRVVLNRFFALPIFFTTMYLTFWITINFAGCFIDFFDHFMGALCVEGFGAFLEVLKTPVFLKTLLADGIGGGIQTVSTFIPPIFFMFLCLALLEDSGYMARAAFVMDKLMRAIGLPGKAFVPLIIGFGCNVPAIMATRTLNTEKDRVLTILMNPFMSCGARMPVYALFAAAFFPKTGGIIVFVLYLTGVLLAILTAFLLKSTILKGETSTFIMELPPYHVPTLKGVLIHTWERLKGFIIRAGRAILLVIVILSFFNSMGTDGSFGNQDSEHSVLSKVGQALVPIFKPMGMTADNWPAAVGVFTGVFAKESVVGTLDALYTQIDIDEKEEQETHKEISLVKSIGTAFATIPVNFSELVPPFSFAAVREARVEEAAERLDVRKSTYVSLRKRFDGKVGAFAYLLMILLYMPCVAAIAAVYRELNIKWTIFSICYLSGLAWLIATLFYQVCRFNRHPSTSLGWVVFIIFIFIMFVGALKRKAPHSP